MIGMLNRFGLAMFVAALMAAPGVAWADQIDGHWCYKDGRNLSIRGPVIITPGGTEMNGDYDRHGFAYVVPEGEEGTGERVLMMQQDHNTIHVWRKPVGTATAPDASEVWHRCESRTS